MGKDRKSTRTKGNLQASDSRLAFEAEADFDLH